MNAFVRNECEKELLTVFNEIILSLNIDVSVESEAFKEGGLKEIMKGSNAIVTSSLFIKQSI